MLSLPSLFFLFIPLFPFATICRTTVQQGLEDLLPVKDRLVVEAVDGGGEGRFGYLRDGAQIFPVVPAVTEPASCVPYLFSTTVAAAVTTIEVTDVD